MQRDHEMGQWNDDKKKGRRKDRGLEHYNIMKLKKQGNERD